MMANPRIGQWVQLWYGARWRPFCPYHGAIGMVARVSRGRGPRNHGVRVGGRFVVVPCGNLRKVPPMLSSSSGPARPETLQGESQ